MKNTSEFWNGFRIERINEFHYPAIIELLNSTFNTNFTVDFLQKKYATAFLDKENIGYIAFDGDLAVGYQMGLLLPLIYQHKTYLFVQACDAATHLNYQKQGLFTLLNNYIVAQFAKEKIKGIIGFPNQNSYPIFIHRLAYSETLQLKRYQLNIHRVSFWGVFRRLKLEKLAFGLAFNAFKKYQIPPFSFSSFDDEKYLIVNRTPAYLTYKTRLGSFFVRLHDTVFWVKIKNGDLLIGDFKTPSESHFEKAMKTLKTLCFRAGLKSILFHTHTGSFEETLFAKRYDTFDSFPLIYQVFDDTIPYHLLRCTYADLDTF